MIPTATRYIGPVGSSTSLVDSGGSTVLDFSGNNVRVVIGGGALTALGTMATQSADSVAITGGAAQLSSLGATPLNADYLTGTIDVARLPALASQIQVVSSGAIADLSSPQQSTITIGAIVTTTDGRRWIYSGSGSKTSEASYIEVADITPDWSVVANRPTNLTAIANNSSGTLTLTNVTLNAAGLSSTPLNASNLSSGTIPDARFTTGTTLIGAARGVRVVADGAALAAATPDFAGQLMVSLDGSFAIPRTASAGHHTDAIVFQAGTVYIKSLNTASTALPSTLGETIVAVDPSSPFVDNSITVYNFSGGYATTAYRNTEQELATGVGPDGISTDLRHGYIAMVNRIDQDDDPGDLAIGQHKGLAGQFHRKIFLDGADKTMTLYGWTEAVAGEDVNIGPIGLHIATTGKVGCGTSSVGSVAQLKIDGPAGLKSYAVASLPAASEAGNLIYISDETSGATLAFSDGANWRRVQDRAVVS